MAVKIQGYLQRMRRLCGIFLVHFLKFRGFFQAKICFFYVLNQLAIHSNTRLKAGTKNHALICHNLSVWVVFTVSPFVGNPLLSFLFRKPAWGLQFENRYWRSSFCFREPWRRSKVCRGGRKWWIAICSIFRFRSSCLHKRK